MSSFTPALRRQASTCNKRKRVFEDGDKSSDRASVAKRSVPGEGSHTSIDIGHALATAAGISSKQPVRPGLRQQHIAALGTVLHRSILEGDFHRARRSWSILLRLEIDGHSLDLRKGDRWGLGAELCSRDAGQEHSTTSSDSRNNVHDETLPSQDPSVPLGSTAYIKTQEYLDRLLLQNPHRKVSPNVVHSLDLHRAKLGLGIRFIAQHEEMARRALASSQTSLKAEVHVNAFDQQKATGRYEEQDRGRMLAQVQTLTEQLDDLLSTPQFSDHSVLLHLREMIELWIADLSTNANSE